MHLSAAAQDAVPAQLTPSFFDSIFNDGMNPFDECFTNANTATSYYPPNQRLSKARNNQRYHGEKPIETRIHSHVDADLQLLRMKQTSPLSPPVSPETFKQNEFTALVTSRSPSPYSFSHTDPFLPSPTSSTSPITSPEEASAQQSELKGTKQLSQDTITLTVPSNPDANNITSFHRGSQLDEPHLSRRATIHSSNAVHELSQGGQAAQPSTSNLTTYQSDPSSVQRAASFAAPSTNSTNSRGAANIKTTQKPAGESGKKRKSKAAAEDKTPTIKPEEDSAESTSFMAINEDLPRKRKSFNGDTRLTRQVSEESDDMDDDLEEEEAGLDSEAKRARFLERNRIAASKCRKKKKMMNARLEEKSRVLQTENRYLNIEREQLKADVCKLKQIVLMHHSCGCEAIQKYLKQEAGKFFDVSNESGQGRPQEVDYSKVKNNKIEENSDVDMGSNNWDGEMDGQYSGYDNYAEQSINGLSNPQPGLMDMKDEDFALMFDHMGH